MESNFMPKNRAIFIDRDGVICEDGYISSPEQLKLLSGAADAIAKINKLGFLAIVITNQPVIARGECTEEDVQKINQKMVECLLKKGARIDAVYYCPHHPEQRNDIPEWAQKYRIDCDCRKPKPGLFIQAAREHNIDLTTSFMIGDSTRDILAGKNAGCKTILVGTGCVGKDGKFDARPDAVAEDILEAVNMISEASEMPAVILVGGRGERLRPLTDDVPKPLLPIAGKPVLEWQLELLRRHGIKRVFICGHYLLSKIQEYFGDGSRFGLEIEYIDDGSVQLGSGGALKNLKDKINKSFILLSGDVMTTLDITALALTHTSSGSMATVVVRETDHPQDSDIIQMDENGRAIKFFSKGETTKTGNLGIVGAFALNPAIFQMIETLPCNFENDLLAPLVNKGTDIHCYFSRDYFKDIGTPERYTKAQNRNY